MCVFLYLDNHPEHKKIWEDFKQRDILRKFHTALNNIPLSRDQLMTSTLDETRNLADNAERSQKSCDSSLKYVVDVPKVPIEFPDMANNKTEIYPLPISQENQCKTIGLAQNLDMFAQEFGFQCNKKTKFLPLKKNQKEFDLDLAYSRYAFLKSMERHRENQALLDATLRGNSIQDEDCNLIYIEENDNEFSSSDED